MGVKARIAELFPLFGEIRMKVAPSLFVLWFCHLFVFVQCGFMAVCAVQPTDMIQRKEMEAPGGYVLLALLFTPWYVQSEFLLFDVVIVLLVQVSLMLLIANVAARKRKGCHISMSELVMIRKVMCVLSTVATIPICFRAAHAVNCIVTGSRYRAIVSLVLCFVSIAIQYYIVYCNSVFFEQFDFVPDSVFAMYEGKSTPYEFWHRVIATMYCLTMKIIPSSTVQLSLSFLLLVFVFVSFYLRVLPCPHSSLLGQFVDSSPWVNLAITVIARSAIQHYEPYLVVIYAAGNVLYLGILVIIRRQINRRSIDMFNVFTNRDVSNSTFSESRGVSPHNYVTVIRTYGRLIGNPTVFERFLQMQMQMGKRASIQIEVIRFLALFPSKRQEMLQEIEDTVSKNLHNRFILYMFKERLTGLVGETPHEERAGIEKLYQLYVSSLEDYWTARDKNHKWKSLTNGLKCVNLLYELRNEFKYLLWKYPFDEQIRKLYVEFLILVDGDLEKIKNQKNIIGELMKDHRNITDPLLHAILPLNPRVFRFLNQDEQKICVKVTTAFKTRDIGPIAQSNKSKTPFASLSRAGPVNNWWTILKLCYIGAVVVSFCPCNL